MIPPSCTGGALGVENEASRTVELGSWTNFLGSQSFPAWFQDWLQAKDFSAIHVKAATMGGAWINNKEPLAATCIKEVSPGTYIIGTGAMKMVKLELSREGAKTTEARYNPDGQGCSSIVSAWDSGRNVAVAASPLAGGYGVSSLTLVTAPRAQYILAIEMVGCQKL